MIFQYESKYLYLQVGKLSEQLKYSGKLDVGILGKACLSGLEKNSLKSYKSKFNAWKNFAVQNCLDIFPVNIIEFKVFLCMRIQEGACWSTINSTISALKFFNKILHIDQVIDFEPSFVAYLKKFSRNPNKRRRPLTKDEFDSVFQFFGKQYVKDFEIARSLCILSFSYLGFLRYDDISQIKLCDVGLQGKIVKMNISQAKNDYEKKGQSVQFELSESMFDIFSFYLAHANFSKQDWQSQEKFLFFHVTKNGKKKFEKSLQYDDMRYIVLCMCQKAGVNITRLGTHSLRIGATSHATRLGVPDKVIDAHGGWAEGSRARQGYQRVNWEDLSVISKVLK